MPYRLDISGFDDLYKKIVNLKEKAPLAAALALYEGAGVMADAVSGAVQGIATKPFRYVSNGWKRLPSPEEKALLANAKHGISKFKKDGANVQTSVGMQNSGYGQLAGRTKPVPLIANAINSGTYFMTKQPFFRQAVAGASPAAAARIEEEIQKRVEELNLDE